MKCFGCGRIRPAAFLLAFWPVGDPDRLRHVCRPSLAGAISCFSDVVGPRAIHEIALADPAQAAAAVPLDERGPTRPLTAAWTELMAACHVRAAA